MDLFFPFSFLFSPFFLFSLSTRVFAETPLHVYFVLPVARQGQSSRYLKHEDKLRVNQSVFYLLFEGTLFKQPMASSATRLFVPLVQMITQQ